MLKREFNKYCLYLYILLFTLSIYPIIFSAVISINDDYNKRELFSIELSQLKSVDDMLAHIDGIYSANFSLNKLDTVAYVSVVSDVVKRRFYHGLSVYSINDNWISYLGSKLFWSHLNAIVNPDDILHFSEGLCSQQTIVFLEILKRRGIHTRWVGLGYKEGPGHFLAEVSYHGTWHLYDVNLEPKWNRIKNHHKSLEYYKLFPDTLYKTYEGILYKDNFYKIMRKVKYGNDNEFPAKNMFIFHQVTKILTYIFPFLFLLMIGITINKKQILGRVIKKIPSQFKRREKIVFKN